MLPGKFHLKVECVTKMKAVLQTELYEDSYEIDQRVPTGRVVILIGKWICNHLSRSIIFANERLRFLIVPKIPIVLITRGNAVQVCNP